MLKEQILGAKSKGVHGLGSRTSLMASCSWSFLGFSSLGSRSSLWLSQRPASADRVESHRRRPLRRGAMERGLLLRPISCFRVIFPPFPKFLVINLDKYCFFSERAGPILFDCCFCWVHNLVLFGAERLKGWELVGFLVPSSPLSYL